MARVFDRIGVVGAGAMGRGIARVAAAGGATVTLTDLSADAAGAAREAIAAGLASAAEKGRIGHDAARDTVGRIRTGADLAEHAGADLVIEAAVENRDVKVAIFRELAAQAPGAVLASNTSSIPIGELADASGAPVIGLHFFNPAHVMRLVEVILPPGRESHWPRLEATLRVWGKTPVRAPDTPGFIVNRCARPFYGEALALAEEGTAPAAVDAAMTEAGYPMGPFALIDLVGADVNLAATETVRDAMGGHPRYHVFEALRRAVAEGRLGRKSGRGFVTPSPPETPPAPGAAARIEVTLVNEAASLVDEGKVTPGDIDTAMTLGLNFPRGPFEIARTRGPARVAGQLAALDAAAPEHLRGRYAPARTLLAMADANGPDADSKESAQ